MKAYKFLLAREIYAHVALLMIFAYLGGAAASWSLLNERFAGMVAVAGLTLCICGVTADAIQRRVSRLLGDS